MIYSYKRSAIRDTGKLLADISGLITGTLDFKTVSTACDAANSTTSGSKVAKIPTAFTNNQKTTLAFATQVDPNNSAKTVRKVTETSVAATEYWMNIQHPLYAQKPFFGLGVADEKKGIYLKLAATAEKVIEAIYGGTTSFVGSDGNMLIAGEGNPAGQLNVVKYNGLELALGGRIWKQTDLINNVKGVYTITLPEADSDWNIPFSVGLATSDDNAVDITAQYEISLTFGSDIKANTGKSLQLKLVKSADGTKYEWANADRSYVVTDSVSNAKLSVSQNILRYSLFSKVLDDANAENAVLAGQFLIKLEAKNLATKTVISNEIIVDVATKDGAATRPPLTAKPYAYITDGTDATKITQIYTKYSFGGQTGQSEAGTLLFGGDLTVTTANNYFEFIVSNSGILFVNNNQFTQNDQMFNNPLGIFYLEAVSTAEKGINATNGVSMITLGSLNTILEALTIYNGTSGEVEGPNIIYNGLVNLASLGLFGTTTGPTSSEAIGYSHNGILETSFVETYIVPGNFLYAKLYGFMRPMLTMNHARYEIQVDSKDYVGIHIPALAAYANSLANPASQLFTYVFK